MIRVGLLFMAFSCGSWAADPSSKFSIAGLTPGMSQPAAKSAGLKGCHIGQGDTESKEAVYCQASHPGFLAGQQASEIKAVFKGPRHTTLNELHVKLSASPQQAAEAFKRAWGAPSEDERHLVWESGPTQLRLYSHPSRFNTAASITITHDAERGRLNQQAAAAKRKAEAKQAEVLKAFK